jgi:hypothetical protein
MPNGKKALRSRDRILEIPTAAPFAAGLVRVGGGAERMTWPIEEMPYHDMADLCLDAPWNYVSGKGSR